MRYEAALDQLRDLSDKLVRRRYLFSDEKVLHEGIKWTLTECGIPFDHEVEDGNFRYDFVLPAGIIVEVKIKGTFEDALRQVARYASREHVSGVALVATTAWSRRVSALQKIHDKPVLIIPIQRQAF